MSKGRTVARTRNAGTMTEAQFKQRIRSALRQCFRYWKPGRLALKAAEVPGSKPKRYTCAHCKAEYPQGEVEVDHIVPCGGFDTLDDIPGFIRRMTPESPEAFQVLCVDCHRGKTLIDREAGKGSSLFD